MTKYTLLTKILILTLTFNFIVFAQIPNSSFETWVDTEPQSWISSNITGVFDNVSKSSDSYDGSSSVKLEIKNYFNLPYSSFIFSSEDSTNIGHTVNAKYNSLIGYYKCDLKSSAAIYLTVFMYDENESPIATGGKVINTSSSNWTMFEIPIEYVFDKTPKYCYEHFAIYDTSGSNDLNAVGSYILIDKLSLSLVTNINQAENLPNTFSLSQNYPNPFNPNTTISFANPELSNIKISIYNSIGEEIQTLLKNDFDAGKHEVIWNAENFSSGVYFIRIEAISKLSQRNFVNIKKAILLK